MGVASNDGYQTIGTASVNLLENRNGRRMDYTITNSSPAAQIITISRTNAPAVANYGIRLNVGESWTEATSENYPCTQCGIQVISSAAGGTVSYSEKTVI